MWGGCWHCGRWYGKMLWGYTTYNSMCLFCFFIGGSKLLLFRVRVPQWSCFVTGGPPTAQWVNWWTFWRVTGCWLLRLSSCLVCLFPHGSQRPYKRPLQPAAHSPQQFPIVSFLILAPAFEYLSKHVKWAHIHSLISVITCIYQG